MNGSKIEAGLIKLADKTAKRPETYLADIAALAVEVGPGVDEQPCDLIESILIHRLTATRLVQRRALVLHRTVARELSCLHHGA